MKNSCSTAYNKSHFFLKKRDKDVYKRQAIEMAKACQDAGDPVVTRIFQPIVKVDVL